MFPTVRQGRLELTHEHTECCQYYAFFFSAATPLNKPELFKTLVRDFGPGRDTTAVYPDIEPTNVLFGHLMRLELLARYGLKNEFTESLKGFYGYMAEKNGSLWEHKKPTNSLNQAANADIVYLISRLWP